MRLSRKSIIVRDRLLGHNGTPWDRSKNRPVGQDVEVHKRLEFVALNTNCFRWNGSSRSNSSNTAIAFKWQSDVRILQAIEHKKIVVLQNTELSIGEEQLLYGNISRSTPNWYGISLTSYLQAKNRHRTDQPAVGVQGIQKPGSGTMMSIRTKILKLLDWEPSCYTPTQYGTFLITPFMSKTNNVWQASLTT